MFQIKVKDQVFEVTENTVNGEPTSIDLLDFKDGTFHILKNNKSYKALLVNWNEEDKLMTLSINGNEYELNIKDKFDLLLEKLGMSAMQSAKVNNIKAPMPGLVLSIDVAPGDSVSKGDAVMILEAMKMENLIKSPGDGIIKSIAIKKGEAVEKNQVLIEFE